MAIDPARQYLDAKAKLDSAEQEVKNLSSYIGQIANAMQGDYWSFMVSNTNIGFPPEVAMGAAFTLNANEWPSAQKIAETLKALHDARHEANNAWARLSPDDRRNLPPPPGAK